MRTDGARGGPPRARLASRSILFRAATGLSIAMAFLVAIEGLLRIAGFTHRKATLTVENRYNREAAVRIPESLAPAFAATVQHNMVMNPLTVPDPDLMFRVLPDPPGGRIGPYDGINAQGFRGRDPAEAGRVPSARRVLVLGDSIAFGWGLPDTRTTFPAALERELDASGDGEWEVYNLGQPGYSTTQGRRLFDRWAGRIEPHAVVLAFGWNDVWPTPWLTDAQAMALLRVHNGASARLLRDLRIYQAVDWALSALVRGEPARPSAGETEGSDRVGREESLDNLSRMIDGRPAVVLLPGYDPSAAGLLHLDRIARYNARTRQGLAGRAALVWPDAMQPASPGVSGYFQLDGFHPNPRGAEMLAQEVARVLRERMGLVGRHAAYRSREP